MPWPYVRLRMLNARLHLAAFSCRRASARILFAIACVASSLAAFNCSRNSPTCACRPPIVASYCTTISLASRSLLLACSTEGCTKICKQPRPETRRGRALGRGFLGKKGVAVPLQEGVKEGVPRILLGHVGGGSYGGRDLGRGSWDTSWARRGEGFLCGKGGSGSVYASHSQCTTWHGHHLTVATTAFDTSLHLGCPTDCIVSLNDRLQI